MRLFALVALLLVCALLSFGVLITSVGLVRGTIAFGGGGQPVEWLAFAIVGVSAGYGLYASGRALLVSFAGNHPHRANGKSKEWSPEKKVGCALLVFGAGCLELAGQMIYANHVSARRLDVCLILGCAILCFLAGSVLMRDSQTVSRG